MRIALILAAFCAIPADGQTIDSLLEEASGQRVEVFADVAFRMMETGKVDRRKQAEAIEQIYHRAGAAVVAHPMVHAGPGKAEGRAFYRAMAARYGMDALSIRARAILAMAEIEERKARTWVVETAAPQIESARCNSDLMADAGMYWKAVSRVARGKGFSKEEMKRGEPSKLADAKIRAVGSTAELVAAIGVAQELVEANLDTLTLAAAYTTAFENVNGTDREFTYAVKSQDIQGKALTLAQSLEQRGASPAPLTSAMKDWMARHAALARCEDSRKVPENHDEYQAAAKSLDSLVAELRRGKRSTADWKFAAAEAARKIERFRAVKAEDRILGLHQQTELWSKLFDMGPGGTTARVALDGLIGVLNEEAWLREAPGEWRSHLDLLMVFAALPAEALAALAEKVPDFPVVTGREIPEALAGSGNQTLSLYGRMMLALRSN